MKTPQLPYPKLSETLGIASDVWLKREDLHHYGSHKGRSVPFMIGEYYKNGIKNFVLSSTGNAALAAVLAAQTHNKNKSKDPISLQIFVGENIDKEKLNKLKKLTDEKNIFLTQTKESKREALKYEKENKGKLLRQSTDNLALLGYHELAEDLAKIENLAAVFIPTSSGTTAQGLYDGFVKLGINPQIHIVQTTSCHPMVTSPLQATSYKLQASLATAIADKVAHRKTKVEEAIKNSRGSGWIATNDEICAAIKLIKETAGINISPNSALSVAGLVQAIKSGQTWKGPVVCLITGE